MCKENQQDEQKQPLSAYIMVAAVVILTLWLVYFVNVEVLPLIFDIDRELYRQSLINLVTQTMTTTIGVFLGMLAFHALNWSPLKSDRKLREDASTQGSEQAEETACPHSEHCK